jgi:hypothetical protein
MFFVVYIYTICEQSPSFMDKVCICVCVCVCVRARARARACVCGGEVFLYSMGWSELD